MVRHITPLALYTHLMIKNECMVNYIIEGDQAVATRMSATPNSECLPEVMEIIQRVMSEISPYADAYRHMHSIEQAEERSTETVNREPQEVRLFFKRGPDCRRYNEPTHDEVAAVFVGEDGAPPVNRDIVIYPRDRLPQRISYMSCHLDPMCYPILFPRGDSDWHNCMTHVAEHQTSTRKKSNHAAVLLLQTGCTIRVQSHTQLGEVVPAICSGCICKDRRMQIVLRQK